MGVAGAPHAVIEDLQRRGEADLVVMGGLARGRLAELLIGSTAERVLHQGFGDVLVVKSPQKPATPTASVSIDPAVVRAQAAKAAPNDPAEQERLDRKSVV